ncbi:MAG TPA: hypothetical protein VD928_01550 [Candidatus Paceibacterota bacterium]|nr:hypothetical protein [Candidatus Paceibacterota bacterium]
MNWNRQNFNQRPFAPRVSVRRIGTETISGEGSWRVPRRSTPDEAQSAADDQFYLDSDEPIDKFIR